MMTENEIVEFCRICGQTIPEGKAHDCPTGPVMGGTDTSYVTPEPLSVKPYLPTDRPITKAMMDAQYGDHDGWCAHCGAYYSSLTAHWAAHPTHHGKWTIRGANPARTAPYALQAPQDTVLFTDQTMQGGGVSLGEAVIAEIDRVIHEKVDAYLETMPVGEAYADKIVAAAQDYMKEYVRREVNGYLMSTLESYITEAIEVHVDDLTQDKVAKHFARQFDFYKPMDFLALTKRHLEYEHTERLIEFIRKEIPAEPFPADVRDITLHNGGWNKCRTEVLDYLDGHMQWLREQDD